ncbi:MAG: hypothetical protein AABY09_05895 [Nanoarchaeota archaeon]
MKKRNKIIAAYGSALIIIAAVTLFAIFGGHPKAASSAQMISSPEIGIVPEEDNLPAPEMGEGKAKDAISQPNTIICPSELEAAYYIDHKRTAYTGDDDVYIGTINNKPQIEKISVTVDENNEGVIEVRSLGASAIKSSIMTAWWDSLDEAASKTFVVQLAPERCKMSVTQITVNYPPSESDYMD